VQHPGGDAAVTDASPGATDAERRALWIEVVRWPLRGGMLGGVIALTVLAWLSAQFEGGATQSEIETRSYGRALVLLAAAATLGHYAWRAVACTYPAERPVPWGGDDLDGTPLARRVSGFVGASLISFFPLVVWLWLRPVLGMPAPAYWTGFAFLAGFGAALFPLGLAGTVVRGSALGALPGPVMRMWRAEPRAARIAWATAAVFVGLLLLAQVLAGVRALVDRTPGEIGPDLLPEWRRWLVFALRAAGFYAALVSFRVAGLLVREVPAIGEVVR
jgi:hypothetical protein